MGVIVAVVVVISPCQNNFMLNTVIFLAEDAGLVSHLILVTLLRYPRVH